MEPIEKFRAALIYLLENNNKGITQSSLSDLIGVSRTEINDLLKGRKNFSDKRRYKISKVFGIEYEDFLSLGRSIIDTGRPPHPKLVYPDTPEHLLIVHVNTQEDKERLNGIGENYRGIPLYESGRLAAGINGIEFDPYEEPVSTVVVYRPELQGCSNNLLALRVGGDSMKPTVTQDSIIVVDLDNKEFFDRKLYVVCLKEDGEMFAAVKRVRKWQNGFVLVSDNPDYPPEPVASDWNELCVGRVVWQWKNMMDA